MHVGVDSPPREFDSWLRSAGDTELARAIVEEPEAYLPRALARIRAELQDRGLEASAVLAHHRREAGAALPAARRRALCRNLLLAGLGLVPGFCPWSREVRCEVWIDNPSRSRQGVQVAGRQLGIPAATCVPLPVRLQLREAPFLRLYRWVRSRGQGTVVRRRYRLTSGRSPAAGWLPVVDGGRLLLRLELSRPLRLELRRYDADGQSLGPPRPVDLGRLERVVDLDRLPLAEGGTVAIDRLFLPLPESLPPEAGEGSRVRRSYSLRRG